MGKGQEVAEDNNGQVELKEIAIINLVFEE